jgi:hypothetical protein
MDELLIVYKNTVLNTTVFAAIHPEAEARRIFNRDKSDLIDVAPQFLGQPGIGINDEFNWYNRIELHELINPEGPVVLLGGIMEEFENWDQKNG